MGVLGTATWTDFVAATVATSASSGSTCVDWSDVLEELKERWVGWWW